MTGVYARRPGFVGVDHSAGRRLDQRIKRLLAVVSLPYRPAWRNHCSQDSSLSNLQHLSVKVFKMASPFYQIVLTILEKIMNCYCFCPYKQLESLLKGYGKVITTRILRGAYFTSKGVAFVR